MANGNDGLEHVIGVRLREARAARGLTIEDLASLSGVSRAMISRIERADASPTAVLLSRLCSALGVSLSAFFEEDEKAASPLARFSEQPVWRDPQSGYVRRSVSPAGTGSGLDIIEVNFPAGGKVVFAELPSAHTMFQHVWVFSGKLEMAIGEEIFTLEAGDCLYMKIADVRSFYNPGEMAARYAVVIDTGKR